MEEKLKIIFIEKDQFDLVVVELNIKFKEIIEEILNEKELLLEIENVFKVDIEKLQ